MLKHLSILLCVLLAYAAPAQRIYFSDSTNKWKTASLPCGGDDGPPRLGMSQYTGDTILHGMLYRIYQGFSYIREDTFNKKVYAIRFSQTDYDTTEYLLYDYNLQVGDTFMGRISKHYVSSIDTVSIDNEIYKLWHLSCASWDSVQGFLCNEFDVLEGVGCLHDPLYPSSPIFFEGCTFVYCFENKGTNPAFGHAAASFGWDDYPYGHSGLVHFDNTSSCNETFALSTKNPNHRTTGVLTIPSPIEDNSIIQLPYEISGLLYVVNEQGQTIIKIDFEKQSRILIGDKVKIPGIYSYKIIERKTGMVYGGKVLKL